MRQPGSISGNPIQFVCPKQRLRAFPTRAEDEKKTEPISEVPSVSSIQPFAVAWGVTNKVALRGKNLDELNPNSEIGNHDLTQSVGGKAICRNST
jgi:hypothetical protein